MIDGMVKKMARPMATIGLCCAAALSLQGCVELMIGSAVVGTFAATDRRTFGAQADDKAIVLKGENRMRNALGSAAHINVSSFNRRALLTGEVADERAKETAEREMRAVDGVLEVGNELEIGPITSYSTRSNDTLITTKVKASFVDTKDLYGSAFKVVTENGAVFLMGRVTQREGNLAGDVTRGVSGVRKVVKIFDYISEPELKNMLASPDKQEAAK